MINRGDIKLAIDMVVNAQDDNLFGGEAEYVINTLEDCGNTIAAQAAVIEKLQDALRSVCGWFDAVSSDNLLLDWQRDARSALAIPTDSTQILEQYVKEKTQVQAAVIERLLAFIKYVAEQTPEKPDYWSSCGQCSSNSDEAEDLLAMPTDSTQILADVRRAERERVAVMILNGRFLHDESPAAQFAKEVATAIRAMED